jgi:hypothetical protein
MTENPYGGTTLDSPYSWERIFAISTRTAGELRKFTEVLFPPLTDDHTQEEKSQGGEIAFDFLEHGARILEFIGKSNLAEGSKESLISSFFIACCQCSTRRSLDREFLERLICLKFPLREYL